MSHSKCKIWIHAIFATKDRRPLIHPRARAKIHALIRKELVATGCWVELINGTDDHVHALFLLNPKVAVTDVQKQVKGASSHEVNASEWIPEKFAWQTGYAAFSVSESHVAKVREYIRNQEEHHRTLTFAEEYERFLKHYGLLESSGFPGA